METNRSTEPLVDSVESGPVTVVSIRHPKLTDAQPIIAVVNEVRAVSRRSESPNILLDFHRVQHVSLDFLDAMTTVVEEIKARGGTICCCSLKHEAREVLEVLGADVLYAGNSVQHALMRHTAWLEKKAAPKTATPGQ